MPGKFYKRIKIRHHIGEHYLIALAKLGNSGTCAGGYSVFRATTIA